MNPLILPVIPSTPTLRDEVVALCHAVGLGVHGDMVSGPLDSIAILLDLLLFEDQQECCVNLSKSVDGDQNL
ncbi:MAG: hypothetical protein V4631_21950 [Pseudomonadota bacterium]